MGITAVFILCSLGFAIIAQAQDCSRPLAGDHMNLRDDYITQQTFPDGSKVSFVCDHGYTSAGGSASITCTAGTWSTVRLRCERKSCGTLGEVSHGEVNYDGNEFGDTATVTCHPGYMLVGRSSFRCEVNGWSGRLPTCDAVQCTTPEPVANGQFYPQKDFYNFGEVARYSCYKGFVLNGPTETACSDDGEFSPSPPTCVTVQCTTPAPVANGEFYPHKDFYNFGEVARYSCYKGFVLNGPTETACSDDGEFSPSPPTCVKVQCEDPVIENAVYESGSRPPHGRKATVTYRCKPGYIMYGSPTVMCNINNQWSPSLPECKRATTPSVTTATPTTTTKKPKAQDCSRPLAGERMNLRDDYITQQTFPDGSKVSFVCDHGYTSAGGSASITCTAGTWSTVRLRCERKSCGTLGEVPHGEVSYDGNEFGDTATVTCHPGYMLVGRSSFRCEVNGWSGRLPTCDGATPPSVNL